MNVAVTTFRNPFSFFCLPENASVETSHYLSLTDFEQLSSRSDLAGVSHGQYVAVKWKNKWVRGIISLETQFRIWLVDYGIYIRPDESTIYVSLPSAYKRLGTKVFEASICGVIPVQKIMSDKCQIEDEVSNVWMMGAIKRGQELISSADCIIFVPIATLITKLNDIVIGDLYIVKGNQYINMVDELAKFPELLVRNPKLYVEKLSLLYPNRRQHRGSIVKPVFANPNFPEINTNCTLDEFNALCAAANKLDPEYPSDSDDGSTITYIDVPPKKTHFKLTAEEMEHYANLYITIGGREYNVLNVLLNKARDLYMCEICKDAKSVGRACSRSRKTD